MEINPEYSLEGLMLKLELQYFGHLMWTTHSLGKTLMLGKTEGRRRRGWQRVRWLDGISPPWTWAWADSGRWWRTGKPAVLQSLGSKESDTTWWLNNDSAELSWHAPWLVPLWSQPRLAPWSQGSLSSLPSYVAGPSCGSETESMPHHLPTLLNHLVSGSTGNAFLIYHYVNGLKLLNVW